MANKRTFLVQGLSSNGVAIGGLASIGFAAQYRNVIQSSGDGAVGSEDVDRAGLAVDASMQCSDVTKINALLNAAVANTVYSGKESGVATWHNYTVPGVVWSSMNLSLSKAQDGSLQCGGKVRFPTDVANLGDLLTLVGGGATAPTLTYPARLYRPSTASFDPDGAPAAIAPLHVESIALSMDAQVFEDYADGDIGHTAVDRGPWSALRVTLVHRDGSVVAGSHRSSEIIEQVRGVLTAQVKGRGGAADKTLTIDNLLWTGVDQRDQADYSEFTLTGFAGWRKTDGTPLTIDGANKLFAFA